MGTTASVDGDGHIYCSRTIRIVAILFAIGSSLLEVVGGVGTAQTIKGSLTEELRVC